MIINVITLSSGIGPHKSIALPNHFDIFASNLTAYLSLLLQYKNMKKC